MATFQIGELRNCNGVVYTSTNRSPDERVSTFSAIGERSLDCQIEQVPALSRPFAMKSFMKLL